MYYTFHVMSSSRCGKHLLEETATSVVPHVPTEQASVRDAGGSDLEKLLEEECSEMCVCSLSGSVFVF